MASHPLPVRRLHDFVIGFLQIPPRDGHPCLDGWFRSLRSIGDLHPLNAHHYSTHQAKAPAHNWREPSRNVETPELRTEQASRRNGKRLMIGTAVPSMPDTLSLCMI